MDLFHLECFVAVARLQTLTAAAEYMHVSQPAVTKRLQSLEHEFGITLFQRNGRRLILSQAGQSLLPQAEKILDDCYKWQAAARKEREQGVQTVQLSLRAASAYMPQILQLFEERHPGVNVEVIQGNTSQADLYLGASHFRPTENDVRILLKEQIVLAVPATMSFVERQSLALSSLRDCKLISLCSGQSMRETEEYLCGQAGFTPQHMVECDTPGTLRNLVTQGLGCAFAAEHTWFVTPNPAIQLIPFDPPCWRYITLRVGDRCANPAVKLMADTIVEFFERLSQLHS